MGYYVPNTLKQYNQWVVWDETKTPYSPITRGKAKTNNPATWGSYEQAVDFMQYGGEFKGVGFVFTDNDDLVFIDLDHCIDDAGEISGTAEEVLKMFSDSYIELSQSETGLHIICKGSIKKSFRNDSEGIEVYSSGRYMAFTGNALQPCEPRLKLDELETLCKRYDKKYGQPKATQKPQNARLTPNNLKVDEVIQNIIKSRQGAKFKALHAGAWESIGIYPSQSEADQAYFNIVNFFTGGNDELTEAVYACSELSNRAKGQRIDYIKRTIAEAKRTATGCKTTSKGKLLKPVANTSIGGGTKKKVLVRVK